MRAFVKKTLPFPAMITECDTYPGRRIFFNYNEAENKKSVQLKLVNVIR